MKAALVIIVLFATLSTLVHAHTVGQDSSVGSSIPGFESTGVIPGSLFAATGTAPPGGTRTADRTGFLYQAGRKLMLGTLAGLNSELLFGNGTPGEALVATAMLYLPSAILLDELIQLWDLDALSTFYLGSLYGIWLEGLLVGTIPESPLWFLTAITTFWHGLITTYTAAEITEVWLPRRAPGTFQPGWTIAGAIAVGLLPFLVPKAYGISIDQWPAYVATAGVAGGFSLLLAHRIRSGRTWQPTPAVALGTAAIGFGLGLGVIALTAAEEPDFYSLQNHLVRGSVYLVIESATLVKVLVERQARR